MIQINAINFIKIDIEELIKIISNSNTLATMIIIDSSTIIKMIIEMTLTPKNKDKTKETLIKIINRIVKQTSKTQVINSLVEAKDIIKVEVAMIRELIIINIKAEK